MLTIRKTAFAGLVLMASAISPLANAGVSATAGFVTDYYFRGVNLGDAGAYASLDYEESGFYAGTWWIDDATGGNNGLETDFYLGYGQESGDFSWGIGYNQYEYTYTSDFESEVVLSLGYGPVSFEYASGTDDNEQSGPSTEFDYDHWALGLSGDVFGVTYGSYEPDVANSLSFDYIEFSATGTVGEFDITLVAGDASFDIGDPGAYMFLDVGRSFDF